MNLSTEELDLIETFGGLNYPPEKIVMILDVDQEQFFLDFNLPDSDPDYKSGHIRYHYDRGQVMAQAEIDKANLRRAKEGNLTSIAQYKKDIIYRDVQNAKRKTIYQQEKTYLEDLKILIEQGNSANLTSIQIDFIEQIDYVRSLHLRWNSKPFIINAVRLKWPKLARNQVVKLYNDAINFFYLDNEIKVEAWRNIYAEKLDCLAALAIEISDIEQARRCLVEAAEIRGVNKDVPQQIPEHFLNRQKVFYTMDVEKLGLPKINRYELAAFIDKLDLTSVEKLKLKRDSMIENSPLEILLEDEKN
ncbi:MAG: hypothetical protein NTX61_06360 [Bacteroidetes bacterium]|nr:hypothetical protein [Bacteroidota bacterium]